MLWVTHVPVLEKKCFLIYMCFSELPMETSSLSGCGDLPKCQREDGHADIELLEKLIAVICFFPCFC